MDSHQRIETLYALSLAITPEDTLEATAVTALDAYLDHLDCSVGAVFERHDTGECQLAGPDAAVGTDDPLHEAAADRVAAWVAPHDEERALLPITRTRHDDGYYWLLDLPEFCVLMLALRC